MVFEKQRRACDLDLSLNELSIAHYEMLDNKALGLDGFPCELYHAT
jgi:hypothetical protein